MFRKQTFVQFAVCSILLLLFPADTKRKRRRTRTEKESVSVAATEITAVTIERNTPTARRRRAKTKIGRGSQTETKATSRSVSCLTAGKPSVASPATLDLRCGNRCNMVRLCMSQTCLSLTDHQGLWWRRTRLWQREGTGGQEGFWRLCFVSPVCRGEWHVAAG